MSIVITDPALLAQIARVSGTAEITDPTGRVIARLLVETPEEQLKRFKCPFTPEELDRRSQNRTGRPIGDAIRDLKARYGE